LFGHVAEGLDDRRDVGVQQVLERDTLERAALQQLALGAAHRDPLRNVGHRGLDGGGLLLGLCLLEFGEDRAQAELAILIDPHDQDGPLARQRREILTVVNRDALASIAVFSSATNCPSVGPFSYHGVRALAAESLRERLEAALDHGRVQVGLGQADCSSAELQRAVDRRLAVPGLVYEPHDSRVALSEMLEDQDVLEDVDSAGGDVSVVTTVLNHGIAPSAFQADFEEPLHALG
jgi:hypothetical protein